MLAIIVIVFSIISIGVVLTAWYQPKAIPWLLAGGAIIIILSLIFWQAGLVALGIISSAILAQHVLSGKISGTQAVKRSLIIYTLLILFTWLAVDLSKPLFFHGQSRLLELLSSQFAHLHSPSTPAPPSLSINSDINMPALLGFAGIILLAAGILTDSKQTSMICLGVGLFITLVLGLPCFFEWVDAQADFTPHHPFRPILKFALAGMLICGVITAHRKKF